jgi:cell shape-determining protein MreD
MHVVCLVFAGARSLLLSPNSAQLVLAFLTYVEDEAVGALTAAVVSAGKDCCLGALIGSVTAGHSNAMSTYTGT